ncbi:murein L,D-transpeptidase catalytic domain family protein [Hymenobacter sp. BT594]|uniref:Murein L,D-transpeptidase catalytic domain family protein n=2 Tax=Hymenobacter guriensis TaxID=2793065 RepID=A0ABS0L5I3_9BACT|nr:murein L,D-transpeptidase catalytic domain family protein [Hymenobacter guriensis]
MKGLLRRVSGLMLGVISVLGADAAVAASPRPAGNPRTVQLSEVQRAFYQTAFEQEVLRTYTAARLSLTGLRPDVYRQALLGYYNLQQHGSAAAGAPLTIIDFNLPSRQKRLWVIDVRQNRLLHHTLVAHGKNTGEDLARTFSNRNGSEMSSLGFYVTGQPYTGKHGLSLKLHGMDDDYNSHAADRAVVVHGADYVSEAFVRQHGRLGRSQGCPALPVTEAPRIIRAIQAGSVVFAHAPQNVSYASAWLTLDSALYGFARAKGLQGVG